MNSGEKGMNPVSMTIINPRKEYWLYIRPNSDLFLSPGRYPLSYWARLLTKERNGKKKNQHIFIFYFFPQYYLHIIFHFKDRPCQISPGFSVSSAQVFRKRFRTKGEIAHNEQFLLFPQFFNFLGELSAIFIKFKIIVCQLFQFGKDYNLSFGKGLNNIEFIVCKCFQYGHV